MGFLFHHFCPSRSLNMASPTVAPLRFSRENLTSGQTAFSNTIKYKQVSKSLPKTRNKQLSSSIAHLDSNVSTVLDLESWTSQTSLGPWAGTSTPTRHITLYFSYARATFFPLAENALPSMRIASAGINNSPVC